MRYMTIRKFASESGYSEDAIRSKIRDGIWRLGEIWFRAPDGRNPWRRPPPRDCAPAFGFKGPRDWHALPLTPGPTVASWWHSPVHLQRPSGTWHDGRGETAIAPPAPHSRRPHPLSCGFPPPPPPPPCNDGRRSSPSPTHSPTQIPPPTVWCRSRVRHGWWRSGGW